MVSVRTEPMVEKNSSESISNHSFVGSTSMFLVERTKAIRNSTEATETFILPNSTLSIHQPILLSTTHDGPSKHENISSTDVPVQKITATGIITLLTHRRGNMFF